MKKTSSKIMFYCILSQFVLYEQRKTKTKEHKENYFFYDYLNMVIAPCNKVVKESDDVGAKTVPKNHTNKNTPDKSSSFMTLFAVENIESTALDNESEQLVNDAMKKLQGKLTIIMIAHRPSTVALADRVVEMG